MQVLIPVENKKLKHKSVFQAHITEQCKAIEHYLTSACSERFYLKPVRTNTDFNTVKAPTLCLPTMTRIWLGSDCIISKDICSSPVIIYNILTR